MDSKGSNEEDEQAIALTEISWENSMRNDENPRTHEEVVRTETSVTVQKRTTQQSNPLFSSLQQDGEAEATATMEAELGPQMLYITNEDKPGFIGHLGMELGNSGVNIATFHLGRLAPGDDAICLVEVDGDVSAEVLARLEAVSHVKQVKALHF